MILEPEINYLLNIPINWSILRIFSNNLLEIYIHNYSQLKYSQFWPSNKQMNIQ